MASTTQTKRFSLTNTDDLWPKEGPVRKEVVDTSIPIGPIRTIRELLPILRELRANRVEIEQVPEVERVCRLVMGQIGEEYRPEIERIIGLLEKLPAEKAEEEIKIEAENDETATETIKTESRAVDPYVLQQLLRDLEGHEQDQQMLAELAEKYNIPQETAEQAVARMMATQAEIRNQTLAKLNEEIGERSEELEEIVTTSKDPTEAIGKLKDSGIIQRLTKPPEVVMKSVREAVAEVVIKRQTATVADELMQEMNLIGPLGESGEQRVARLIQTRVAAVMAAESDRLTDFDLNREDGGLRRGLSLEESLINEVGETETTRTQVRIAIKQADKKITELINENAEAVAIYRRMKLEEVLLRQGIDEELTKIVGDTVYPRRDWRMVQYREGSEREAVKEELGYGDGRVRVAAGDVNIIANLVTGKRNILMVVESYKKLTKLTGGKLPEFGGLEATERVMTLLGNNTKLTKSLELVRQVVQIRSTFDGLVGQIFTKVGSLVNLEALEGYGVQLATRIGGQVAGEFTTAAITQVANFGLEQGLKNIIGGLFTGGVKAVAVGTETAGAVTTAGGTAVVTAAGAATTGVGIPFALIILGKELISIVGRIGWKTVTGLFDKISDFVGTGGVDRWLKETFGEKIGGVAVAAGKAIGGIGIVMVGIPAMLIAIPFTLILTPVIIAVIIGSVGYNQYTATQMSSLVPPQMGGGCVRVIDGAVENGEANCPRGLPEQSVEGVDRNEFFRVADTWKNGKNHARECFDAVVCKSKAAGINPVWTLWAWLHESDASNYSHGEIEDFGIHNGKVKKNNFEEQIESFLELDPGGCGTGNYWLDLSTNYLTGDCDPDKALSNGMTGRKYYEELVNSWRWISTAPLPKSIHIPRSSGSCEGDTNLARGGTTIVDEKGQKWLCADEETAGGMSGNIVAPPWVPMGEIPKGCPDRLPVSGGYFTQGPFAPNCSHEHMSSPAIDIGIGGGSEIVATHPGIVKFGEKYDAIYGYYVDVLGNCGGKKFFTRYAHMPKFPDIQNGARVNAGDYIGQVDNTGSSTGNHIHYHINGLSKDNFGTYLFGTCDSKNQNYAQCVQEKGSKVSQLWGCCGVEWNGKGCP